MSDPLLDRQVRRRLAVLRHVEEVTGNVAMTCRYFEISRQLYYVGLRRYRADGLEGLRDRSRRPKVSPRATPVEVVEKILYLRQQYHFGPEKIAMYLRRYHDVTVSKSGVWRILKRLDLNRLPASQRYKRHDRRWKRYQKPLPGHRVQLDVKFIEPPSQVLAESTTSSPPSMTAPASGCCGSISATTSAPRSSSSTTSSRSSPSRSGASRPTFKLRRVPRRLPLARPRSGDRPRLHPAQDPTAQRQGGAIPPD